jgi:hypothetical protein
MLCKLLACGVIGTAMHRRVYRHPTNIMTRGHRRQIFTPAALLQTKPTISLAAEVRHGHRWLALLKPPNKGASVDTPSTLIRCPWGRQHISRNLDFFTVNMSPVNFAYKAKYKVPFHGHWWVQIREYWTIFRNAGFLAVIWFGFALTPSTPPLPQ